MSNILSQFLKEVTQGDKIKDYAHAANLFVANNYELAPKSAYLYFVHFEFNKDAFQNPDMHDQNKQNEIGMLVKQVSLPKFKIDTKTLNAYNRPHVVQTKLHYEPINIVFHDDSANRVRNFWYDYYTYYYRNSDNITSANLSNKNNSHSELTNPRDQADWGYTIRNSNMNNTKAVPYLSNIRIFSMFNKQFSEYVLINPIINSFQHGEHNASEGTGILQHTMTVEYESVLYAYGTVSSNTMSGFADAHYDKSPSPLLPVGGGTQSITGVGGFFNSGADIVQDLEAGNVLGAALSGAHLQNNLRGADLTSMARSEVLTAGLGALQNNNPFSRISIPGLGKL